MLSNVEYQRDNGDGAEGYAREALRFAEENMLTHTPQVGLAHAALGKAFLTSEKLTRAEAHLERGLALQREVGKHNQVVETLFALAVVRDARGDREGARSLLEEGRSVVEACAEPGVLPSLLQRTERRLRRSPRHRAVGSSRRLSEREIDVLRLLATDLSQREIGESLYISFNTVHAHVRSIYRKLGVSSREESVDRASRLGLVSK